MAKVILKVGWKVHGLTSSYDDVLSAVDFFTDGIQAL